MIGFRVDANEKIATGHLMRCIAIAAACQKKESSVCFCWQRERKRSVWQTGDYLIV